MKNLILISNWINRVLMFPFIISLLLSVFENEIFIYPMYIAFVLGIYQLLSFLISLFLFKNLNVKRKKEILVYILIVVLYFFTGFMISENYKDGQNVSLIIFFVSSPILLSIFWTYILETINQEL